MEKPYEKSLFIFRRDLRLEDNSGLIDALSNSSSVVPCFFFDSRLLLRNHFHYNAIQFMVEALKDLDNQLTQKNSQLFCFSDIPEEKVPSLISSLHIDAVYVNRDYTPFSQRRDSRLKRNCDQAGVDYVKNMLGTQAAVDNVRFSPEIAFILDSRRPANMDIGSLSDTRTDKSVVVGLNVSGLLYYGGYTGNNMFGLKEDYEQIICRITDFLMAQKDVLVLLIPHIFPLFEFFEVEADENDVAACLSIYKRFCAKYPDRMFMVRGRYDHCEIKYIIGVCDFFIGSRMHSCIAAISQCIPAVGIAYSKKFKGVFESVSLTHCVVDARRCDKAELIEKVKTVFHGKDQIREHLEHVIPRIKEDALNLFKGLEW